VPTKANLRTGYNVFAELAQACQAFGEKVNGRAVAPVMPTVLVHPVADEDTGVDTVSDAAPGGVAWGVTAVGADTFPRTGADVTVAVLDTCALLATLGLSQRPRR